MKGPSTALAWSKWRVTWSWAILSRHPLCPRRSWAHDTPSHRVLTLREAGPTIIPIF